MRYQILGAVIFLLVGCTTVDVATVDAERYPIDTVCIERNERVVVADFLNVLEQGFLRHGIETAVYDGELPQSCIYSLWYTAERGWDLKPFLDFAELRLKHRGKTIGSAMYRHSGGLALNKWGGTEAKMTPVIDELLAEY